MHRLTIVAIALGLMLSLIPDAHAQKRESEVEAPKVSLKVLGLKKSNVEGLKECLAAFKDRGEFTVDTRRKAVTFSLKSGKQVSFSELQDAVAPKRLKLVFASIVLIGKLQLALSDEASAKLQGRAVWKLGKQLRGIKGVSGLRPSNGGVDMTAAAPGVPVAKIDVPIARAAKLKKGAHAITDVTWHGPSEGGDAKADRKDRKKKGRKGSKNKGDEGEKEEKEEKEDKEEEHLK